MKHTLLFLSLFLSFSALSQIDTILFENFQDNTVEAMNNEATDEMVWANVDQDGLPSILGTDVSKRWYWGEFFHNPVDSMTGETNFVAISISYLEGFLPGNRNWMVLPAIEITDDSYELSWKSAPDQLPRYMDGYSILISNTDRFSGSFTDELFKAASMDDISGDSQSTDYSNFVFTDGYLHADGGTLSEYILLGDATINYGLLEPHSMSLADYAGQTIHIAFLHDSDDDNRLALDDILITKASGPSQLNELEDVQVQLYPNPVGDQLNVTFALSETKEITAKIISITGQLLLTEKWNSAAGNQIQKTIDLNDFTSGEYILNLVTVNGEHSQTFIKK